MISTLNHKLLAYQLKGPGISPGANQAATVPILEKIISNILAILTIVATIFFVIQIILAGFSIISSQGDPKNLESAKKRLTFNVIGLAIVVLAYGLGALITSLLGISNVFDLTTVFKPI